MAEQELLLDTHVWAWYVAGGGSLPGSLRRILDEDPTKLWLSPVSIWELGVLERKGRVRLTEPFDDWVRAALDAVPLKDAPLTRGIALRTRSLALRHHDPGDRFLAATALVLGIRLVTTDRELIAADWLPTVP